MRALNWSSVIPTVWLPCNSTTECSEWLVTDNEPNADAAETMQIHRGTARLVLTGNDELQGDYYTGRGRKNTGGMRLHRKN